MTIPFFAITSRGLEPIVAEELAQLADIDIKGTPYRRVHAMGDLDGLELVSNSRTADDLFLQIAIWQDVRHIRDMLPEFTTLAQSLEMDSALSTIRYQRSLPDSPGFSITANYVGKRNYNADEIKLAVSEGIRIQHPSWTYCEDDADADLNLRVFIDHTVAIVGLRLTETPLHRRAYKQTSQPGSLKATVAAAMVQIAEVKSGQTLLDPFCGSGTIPIEAALLGVRAISGDNDLSALDITLANITEDWLSLHPMRLDAMQMPLNDNSVDCVVSNLPWGRQVQVDGPLQSLYEQSYAEMQRVVRPCGRIVLLTTHVDLIPDTLTQAIEISLYGKRPQILVYGV
jgi:tRNA (guanine6-N2)-methyltransferase